MGALLLACYPEVAAAQQPLGMVSAAMLQLAVEQPQDDADKPVPLQLPTTGEVTQVGANSLQIPEVGEELPPLGEKSVVLSTVEGPDPLLARERSRRRSTADLEPRGETVLERKRPLYDPIGIKSGGFTIFPQLSANVGATTDAVPGGEDLFAALRAAAVARSDWSRHQLVVDGFVNHRVYLTHSSEDGTSWLARARGQLDVQGRDRLTTELSSERIIESRGTVGEFVGTSRPVRLTRHAAEFGGQAERGRFTGRFQLAYNRLNYDESLADDLIEPVSGQRDSDVYRAGVELGYQFAAPRSLFVSATRTARRYDVASNPLRDSNEMEVLAGIQGEITPLIRGRISAGYVWIDFLDPAIRSRGALAFDGRLQYLLTELTTVNFSARRTTRNVASPTSPLAVVTDFRLGADHELLRNLIISASLIYQSANFQGLGNQRMIGGNVGANWLVSPRWRASLNLGSIRRSSGGLADGEYNATTLTAGVTFQF